MYSRKKETEYLFNSGLFLNNIVTFEEDGNIYPSVEKELYIIAIKLPVTLYSMKKTLNRFLLMTDGSQQNGGQILSPGILGG